MTFASVKNFLLQRLQPDSDLLEELEKLAQKEAIPLAHLSGIGALKRAALGIFLPQEARYEKKELVGELEICSLTGNISLKEGKPFVHAHLVVSDREGRAWGGHLLPGCQVFVAEIIIASLEGKKLERCPQPGFPGLALWPVEEKS